MAVEKNKVKSLTRLEDFSQEKFELGDVKEQQAFIRNLNIKLDCAVTNVSDLVDIFAKLKA